MGYNPSFPGGTLAGAVNVPAAVFAQLAARNATYPVPWDPAVDFPVSWLAPHRLMVFIDDGRVFWDLKANATMNATLNGSPIPVLPSWNCRSRQDPSSGCWDGFWIDLTSSGVLAPDTDYALTVSVPSIPASALGAFRGVYFDNVNTVYSSSVLAAGA